MNNSSARCAEARAAPRHALCPTRPPRAPLAGRALPALTTLLAAFALAGCGGAPVRTAEGPGAVEPQRLADAAPVPDDALAAHAVAVDLMSRGDFDAAEVELERIVAAHPGLPGPHVNLAILYRRAGRDEEARAALAHALALDSNHPEANNELGILLRESGEFEAAEVAYRRAIERRPDYALALYNLGVLLDLYMLRPAEALECYEAYQDAAAEPDARVARWIVDLRRRVPSDASAEQVARGDAS